MEVHDRRHLRDKAADKPAELGEVDERRREDDVERPIGRALAGDGARLLGHRDRRATHAPLPLARRQRQQRPVGLDAGHKPVEDSAMTASVVGLERQNAQRPAHG